MKTILMLTVGLMLAGCGSMENHVRSHGVASTFPEYDRGNRIAVDTICACPGGLKQGKMNDLIGRLYGPVCTFTKSDCAKVIALSGCGAYPLHIPDTVGLTSDMEAVVFLVIIIWISLCFVAGAITKNKGNSFIAAFLISLLLSPIIGIVFALAQRPNAGHRGIETVHILCRNN